MVQGNSSLTQGDSVLEAKPGLELVFIIPILLIVPLKVTDSNARFRLLLLILFSLCTKVCREGYIGFEAS